MAIEVPVRKEIATFESRPVFGLTARQLICCGVALPLGIGTYILTNGLWGSNTASTITIFLTLPIFAFGLFKKNGYPLEKYLKIVWAHRYTEQKTYFKTENALVLYMSEEEYKSDLAKRLLSYSDKKTTAQAETNITYHLTEKEEQQGFLLARAECRTAAKLHRALLKQHEKDIHTLKRRDRAELAYLKRLSVGGGETNTTYHLTAHRARQGPLQAKAECRAVAAQHRADGRRHKWELFTLKYHDRAELAHLKRLAVGGGETNITYHLTAHRERQGLLQAKSECRAAGNAYREECRARQKQERDIYRDSHTSQSVENRRLEHGTIQQGQGRAADETQGAQTGAK